MKASDSGFSRGSGRHKGLWRAVTFALLASGAVSTCLAQTGDLHIGTIEFGLLAGNSVDGLAASNLSLPGTGNFRVTSPASGTASIRIGAAANPGLVFFGQVGVLLGQHVNRPLANGYAAQTNLLNITYEGGFQKLMPGKWKSLYVLGTAAAFQKRVDTLLTYVNPGQPGNPVLESATSLRLHRADFAVSAGIGVRHNFVRKGAKSRFGALTEARAYFPTSDVKVPIGMATLGVFVDFR